LSRLQLRIELGDAMKIGLPSFTDEHQFSVDRKAGISFGQTAFRLQLVSSR
jgi:hypothetical protein